MVEFIENLDLEVVGRLEAGLFIYRDLFIPRYGSLPRKPFNLEVKAADGFIDRNLILNRFDSRELPPPLLLRTSKKINKRVQRTSQWLLRIKPG